MMMRRLLSTRAPEEIVLSLAEYVKALEYIQDQKYSQAEQELSRCLQIFESGGLYGQPPYTFLLLRQALVQRAQKKCQLTEKTLEELVTHSKTTPQLQLSYKRLMSQYLHSNVGKAIELGTAVTNDSGTDASFHSEMQFFLGVTSKQTALLLEGQDLSAAKQCLGACSDPESNRGFALHNLACAQWWHLLQTSPASECYRETTLEFASAVPNLQKAIKAFECTEQECSAESPGLSNVFSGLSLTNIAEIYFQSTALDEALKHLKCALKCYEATEKQSMGRALTLIGVFLKSQSQRLHAEGLFRNAVKMLTNVRNN